MRGRREGTLAVAFLVHNEGRYAGTLAVLQLVYMCYTLSEKPAMEEKRGYK